MCAMKPKKVNVGIYIDRKELDEMKKISKVDASGPAVLACARKGVDASKSAS